MSLLRSLSDGLRSLFRKEQVGQELDEELRGFLDMAAEEKMKQGMSRKDALRAVRLERGNLEVTKEVVRSAGWESFVETCWQDLRFAARILWARPGYTAAALLILALGIGANGAIFSLINALLLKPLAVSKPEELVGLYSRGIKQPDIYRGFSYPNYVDIRANNSSVFTSLAAQSMTMVGLKEGDTTRRAFADFVSSNFFSTLGVALPEGQSFTDAEEKEGGELSVIVTYS